MSWMFYNLCWQDPDHQELSLVQKTLSLQVETLKDLRNPGIRSLPHTPLPHTHCAFPGNLQPTLCSTTPLQQTPALIPSLFYLSHEHHQNRSNINQK